MRKRKRAKPDPVAILSDPDLLLALKGGLDGTDKKTTLAALRGAFWASGELPGRQGADSAKRAMARYRGEPLASPRGSASVTLATLDLPSGVQVRAILGRWGGHESAHLRIFYRSRAGAWCPTKRGVTVPPAMLEQLEEMVCKLREANAAGALPAAGPKEPAP